jgi:integrase
MLPKPTEVTRVTRHAAVPYAELPALLAQLRQHEGVAVKALEFLVHAAARVGEVIFATWSEIDFDAATWTIPGQRMKGSREHKVPLSPAAVDLLKSVYTEAGNDFVFIGPQGGALSDSAMTATMRRLGRTETVHGFRSTFSDWAHEQTAFSNHAIELSLAHSIGNAVEKAYRRGEMFDKRRKLMEAWSKYCTTPSVVKQSGDNVVNLGGR